MREEQSTTDTLASKQKTAQHVSGVSDRNRII
jgi:hypothetical protein